MVVYKTKQTSSANIEIMTKTTAHNVCYTYSYPPTHTQSRSDDQGHCEWQQEEKRKKIVSNICHHTDFKVKQKNSSFGFFNPMHLFLFLSLSLSLFFACHQHSTRNKHYVAELWPNFALRLLQCWQCDTIGIDQLLDRHTHTHTQFKIHCQTTLTFPNMFFWKQSNLRQVFFRNIFKTKSFPEMREESSFQLILTVFLSLHLLFQLSITIRDQRKKSWRFFRPIWFYQVGWFFFSKPFIFR